MNYRRTQHFLFFLILGYIGVALVLGLSFYHRELFPVFSWSLFSTVEETKAEFAVLVTHLDGQALEPPLEFMESKAVFRGAGSIRAYYTIQKFGAAALRRRSEEAQRLRHVFESTYLGHEGRPVEYRLIFRRFDAIERWQGGGYTFRPVAEFQTSEGPQ